MGRFSARCGGTAHADPTWLRLGHRLVAAGRLATPLRWSRERLREGLVAHRGGAADTRWVVDLALAHHPGLLLRWLPETSPCAVCPWTFDGPSALLAAKASMALHRPRDVAENAARALDSNTHMDLNKAETAEALALVAWARGRLGK